jgi:integrase
MCYQILKSILDGAVASRLIAESPCTRIALPRVPNTENLYLTAEEVERLAAVIDPHFRALVYSAVYLGCRWGELVGLKRDRLDLLRRQVRIVGSLEEIHGVPRYVEETKSSASRRMLTIPAFLAEILAEHLGELNLPPPTGHRSTSDGGWGEDGLNAALHRGVPTRCRGAGALLGANHRRDRPGAGDQRHHARQLGSRRP